MAVTQQLVRLHDEQAIDGDPGSLGVVCPCCRFITLQESAGFDICPVCYWEDDGQGDQDAGDVRGGPNGGLSLEEARANYRRFGAVEDRFVQDVRLPLAGEIQNGKMVQCLLDTL